MPGDAQTPQSQAELLRQLIEDRGITVRELARRLSADPLNAKKVETKRRRIYKWLGGEAISDLSAKAIAAAVGDIPDEHLVRPRQLRARPADAFRALAGTVEHLEARVKSLEEAERARDRRPQERKRRQS